MSPDWREDSMQETNVYIEAALKVADKIADAIFSVSDSLDKVATAIEESK